MSAISEQYAVALFELALDADQLTDVQQAFDRFLKAFDETTRAFFLSPAVTKNDKKAMLNQLDMPATFRDFLKVLIDNNRLTHLEGAKQAYGRLMDKRDETMRVSIRVGKPLGHDRIEALEKAYQEKHKRRVIVDVIVDESIVGGMRVEYDGMVLSDTVQDNLNKLKSRLTK